MKKYDILFKGCTYIGYELTSFMEETIIANNTVLLDIDIHIIPLEEENCARYEFSINQSCEYIPPPLDITYVIDVKLFDIEDMENIVEDMYNIFKAEVDKYMRQFNGLFTFDTPPYSEIQESEINLDVDFVPSTLLN